MLFIFVILQRIYMDVTFKVWKLVPSVHSLKIQIRRALLWISDSTDLYILENLVMHSFFSKDLLSENRLLCCLY